MKNEQLLVPGIGPVHFVFSLRAKRIIISLRPFKGIRVAIPRGVTLRRAKRFVQEKETWIKKQQKRIGQLEKDNRQSGKLHAPVSRNQARDILVKRLNNLATRYGFHFNRVFIRNQQTRWGSCSAKNNINLNMNLINLPQHLIDYVLLHELVHTRIKNHSKAFWTELELFLSNPKALDRELKKYSIG